MTYTIPASFSRHFTAYVVAAAAALALVISIVLGMAIADSDSSPVVRSSSNGGVQQELPTTPDALERRALNDLDDPARYGSPDAAEEWNR